MRKRPDGMLFDLDGTLFRTETALLPAYHATFEQLRKEGLYEGKTPPEERILSSLGMLLEQIWQRVLPESSAETRRRADELLLKFQLDVLKAGKGELYPHVKSTLEALREEGVRLFVASNGLEAYVKGVVSAQGLSGLFEGLYSAGEYRTRSKAELVRLALERHGLEAAWMVGDRSSDVEAGKRNGLTVVGCSYAGFGTVNELDGADFLIADFAELLHSFS